ncbi:hypothetical protein BH09MYX1_BH09MYX1_10420 [soil metagenome]
MKKKSVAPCVGDGMAIRHVVIRARDVVYLKGVLEASEGLAQVFAESGGDLTIAAPDNRAVELDAVLADLIGELDGLTVVVGGELSAE